MRISQRLGILCGLLCLFACNEEPVGPRPVPTAVTVIAGDGQQGTVGRPLDTTLAVLATDKFGDPVPGVLVRFTAPEGGGELVPVTQTTGPGGEAQSTWTLPTHAGPHTATVLAAGLDPLVFHATAVAASPASLVLISGDSLSAPPSEPVESAVVVLVRDAYGNPVSGASVSFAPMNGSGSVEPETRETDTTGRARTVWTLGAAPSAQALDISIDTLHQIRIRARVISRPSPAVIRMPDYSASEPWGGGSGAAAEESPGTGSSSLPRTGTRLLPELPCWVNALGPVRLQEDAGSALQTDFGLCGGPPGW